MEDEPSRRKLARWKAFLEHAVFRSEDWQARREMLGMLNWIVENTGEHDSRLPRSFTQQLEDMDDDA